jgi:hypothetical protein
MIHLLSVPWQENLIAIAMAGIGAAKLGLACLIPLAGVGAMQYRSKPTPLVCRQQLPTTLRPSRHLHRNGFRGPVRPHKLTFCSL